MCSGTSKQFCNQVGVFLCGSCLVLKCEKSYELCAVKLVFDHHYPSTHLSRLQLTVGSSILFTRTIRCLTPAVLANMACSRVCPPFSNPVSNSPFLAEIT